MGINITRFKLNIIRLWCWLFHDSFTLPIHSVSMCGKCGTLWKVDI